ncbi:hypothetical protein DICPUDRAFT_92220 [Dictyostelium purpureum]|uniref:RING-type domain-containing protein n=1 Tax=Dictyostelium purpureum TaxID=5786 RepID=F0ZNN3_DICPU|nr:uncharacterized protein DICPUDRAFT_92220 [Dictyostelium purpureum]EGC34450.1 hypothetical protein DICPUDRAFT_92220 [Dictyostelium purpureum]|eukprot:XP_003289035.1 hypothetical protein DICPUDRAFT_92220 [Dictyostelium purpureum]
MAFIPPKLTDFNICSSFWVVILNDFIARFCGMIVKSICIIAVGHRPPFKRRGQLYSAIESATHLYRTLLPITVWVSYLYSLQQNGDHIFSSVMIGLYLTIKLSSTIERVKLCFSTLRAFVLHEVLYGKKATSEQIMEAGDVCSICRSNLISPIVLRCNHIFCEDCVSQWFELEKTCPICRTPCRTAGNKTHADGSTTYYLQLF